MPVQAKHTRRQSLIAPHVSRFHELSIRRLTTGSTRVRRKSRSPRSPLQVLIMTGPSRERCGPIWNSCRNVPMATSVQGRAQCKPTSGLRFGVTVDMYRVLITGWSDHYPVQFTVPHDPVIEMRRREMMSESAQTGKQGSYSLVTQALRAGTNPGSLQDAPEGFRDSYPAPCTALHGAFTEMCRANRASRTVEQRIKEYTRFVALG